MLVPLLPATPRAPAGVVAVLPPGLAVPPAPSILTRFINFIDKYKLPIGLTSMLLTIPVMAILPLLGWVIGFVLLGLLFGIAIGSFLLPEIYKGW